MSVENISSTLWLASQRVLLWISTATPEKLPRFIQNRLTEGKSHNGFSHEFVQVEMNPADLATCGFTPSALAAQKSGELELPSYLGERLTAEPTKLPFDFE